MHTDISDNSPRHACRAKGIIVATILALIPIILSAATALAAGNTIKVPEDKGTIQAAIDAAVDGDTVMVAPGTYTENITFKGKAITVTSSGGADATVIDGNNVDSVVSFVSSEGAGSVLDGFTLRNGRGQYLGGGITIYAASPIIRHNRITSNKAVDGGGIHARYGSPLIHDNIITLNQSDSDGGGISLGTEAPALVIDNVIADNSAAYGGGGISLWSAGAPTIRGNIIRGNSAFDEGGGIAMVNHNESLIVQNLIVDNHAASGGGLHWLVPGGSRGPYLISNTIANNDATQGSAVFADGYDKDTLLANNVLAAKPGQSAVFCGSLNDINSPQFKNNIVHSTEAIPYSGLCVDQKGVNGNLTADPLLNGIGAGYYAPLPGSPVIDAGDNAAPSLPTGDLAGSSRTMDGNGDGSTTIDMGAFEFDPTRPLATISGTPPIFTTQKIATFSIGGEGVIAYRYALDGTEFTTAATPVATPLTAEGLSDGFHTLAVTGITAGGGEQLVPFASVATWTVDNTPPVTTASPSGGTFYSIKQVTLACEDGSGSGCKETVYCLGSGCTPATSYTGAITLNHATELRFFSIDKLGNSEAVTSVSFVIGLDLSITTSGFGNGTVSGPDISCTSGTAAGCTFLVPIDEPVMLTAVAKTGSVFGGWFGCDSVSGNDHSICSVKLTSTRSVTAMFNLSLPDRPTGVFAVADNGQATVSFTPPLYGGNTPITTYTATANPGGITASASASPITVTGLTNGVAYTFTVTATNAAGTGQPSEPSNMVVPSNVQILINKGAPYTRSTNVLLDLAYPGATAMQFSTNGKSWSKWEIFAATKQLKLSGANGLKAVSVRFRDGSALISNIRTATIILDSKPPKTGKLTITPVSGGVTLAWQGFSDASSDIVGYRLVSGKDKYPACSVEPLYSGLETAYNDFGFTPGGTTYYQVCAIDSVGNISRGAKAKLKTH